MRKISTHAILMVSALLALAACDAPSDAPEEPIDDQVTDGFSSEQPVVEDPMAGDMVVDEAPVTGGAEAEGSDGLAGDAADDTMKATEGSTTSDEVE